MKTNIIILDEYNPSRKARATIAPAINHSAKQIHLEVECKWFSEKEINDSVILNSQGIFVGPGSLAEDTHNILRAIKIARKKKIPCLGTCGGFQRIVAEYAINVLRLTNIEHEELSPNATDPFFSKLQCSIVGQDTTVKLISNTFISTVYKKSQITESFFCSYGINNIR